MDPKNKLGQTSMALDVVMLIVGFICLAIAASKKDSYQYYFDSGLRKSVSGMEVMGYICLLWGGISLAIGAVLKNNANEQTEGSNLFACPDCTNMISANADSCPHCGWVNPVRKERNSTEQSSDLPSVQQERIPAWKQVEMEKEQNRQQGGE